MKTSASDKLKQKLYNNAFEFRNWHFDKAAKRTMTNSALLVVGSIVLVNILAKQK